MNSVERGKAVQDWIIDAVTVVIDNCEPLHVRVTQLTYDAVKHDMDSGNTWEAYTEACRVSAVREYADVAGIAIRDELRRWFDKGITTRAGIEGAALRDMVAGLIDWNDRDQWSRIGDLYLPAPSDYHDNGDTDW
jgi:hypothetical protein